jgi:ketosteroid isomerase-like protein
MKADEVTEKEVMAVISKFTEAYSKHDLNNLLSVIAPDDDVIVFGLEPDEKCIGINRIKSQLERDWYQTNISSIEFTWISISSAGLFAWIASEALIKIKANGCILMLSSRITSILEKRGDKWLVLQAHFSVPEVSNFNDI